MRLAGYLGLPACNAWNFAGLQHAGGSTRVVFLFVRADALKIGLEIGREILRIRTRCFAYRFGECGER
jgi:hypothetical protein